MRDGEFINDPERYIEWFNHKNIDLKNIGKIQFLLESTWYRHDFIYFEYKLPPYLLNVIGDIKISRRLLYLKLKSEKIHSTKYLLYNWAEDPLFYGELDGIEKIKKEQIKALKYLFIYPQSINSVIKNFIWKSGLLEKVANSFNLTSKDFENL